MKSTEIVTSIKLSELGVEPTTLRLEQYYLAFAKLWVNLWQKLHDNIWKEINVNITYQLTKQLIFLYLKCFNSNFMVYFWKYLKSQNIYICLSYYSNTKTAQTDILYLKALCLILLFPLAVEKNSFVLQYIRRGNVWQKIPFLKPF